MIMLYRADELRLDDHIVGLGSVQRIERTLGEVRLFWANAAAAFVRVGPDTGVLAVRTQRPGIPVATVAQQSHARAAS